MVDPEIRYTDGVITLRRQTAEDLDQHLAAIDAAQMDLLWDPGHRELWEALSPTEQRAHQLRHLMAVHEAFGPGPKWCFSGDLADASYVVYVDCDLACPDAPAGAANVSYVCHPAHRRRGHATRAVQLVLRFLLDHTAATEAQFSILPDNDASRHVALAVGAREHSRSTDRFGRTLVRHVLPLRVG
jgi:RimJ/RimL family protein N-acetyltransferase